MAVGIQFLPGREDDPNGGAGQGGAPSNLQEAIQFLSFRLPRRAAGGAMAPQGLLAGGMGGSRGAAAASSPVAQALRVLAALRGGGSGGGFGEMAIPGGAPAPQFTPGVQEPPAGRASVMRDPSAGWAARGRWDVASRVRNGGY